MLVMHLHHSWDRQPHRLMSGSSAVCFVLLSITHPLAAGRFKMSIILYKNDNYRRMLTARVARLDLPKREI